MNRGKKRVVQAIMTDFVYKVFTPQEYNEFKQGSTWNGSSIDIRDGFIHLSTLEQYPKVIQRFYNTLNQLYVAKIPLANIESLIKWESPVAPDSSKQDQEIETERYPHLYGPLPTLVECFALTVEQGRIHQILPL